MTNIDKAAFAFGVTTECALTGTEPNELIKMSAFCDAVYSSLEFQKAAGLVGRALLAAAGRSGSYEYHVADALTALQEPLKSASCISKFVVPFVATLTETADSLYEEHGVKRATALKGAIGKTIGRLMATTPEMAKLLAIGAVGTGAVGGALAFALNRDSRDDDVDITLKEDQAKYYRQYANSIARKMRAAEAPKKDNSKLQQAVDVLAASDSEEAKPAVL